MRDNPFPQNDDWSQGAVAQRLLTKCFRVIELDYLQQQPEFQKALAGMQTLDAFEIVIMVGHRLLLERDGNPKSNGFRKDFD